jgi:hypothetical protein
MDNLLHVLLLRLLIEVGAQTGMGQNNHCFARGIPQACKATLPRYRNASFEGHWRSQATLSILKDNGANQRMAEQRCKLRNFG